MLWIMYNMTGEEIYPHMAWSWDETMDQWFIIPIPDLRHFYAEVHSDTPYEKIFFM